MNRSGKRMTVLRDEEIKQIYGLSKFTEEQRNTYFALNPFEKQEVTKLRSVKTKVYFILQMGYFKAKKILFVFEPADVKADASHILNRYYSEQDECDTNLVFSYYIRNDHQKRILRLMNYQRASEQIRSELLQKAMALVRIHTKPVYVFRELLVHLENRRIVIPGYTILQNIILNVRWYLRYALSYRDLEEMMLERGVKVDHTTIYRWVQSYMCFRQSCLNSKKTWYSLRVNYLQHNPEAYIVELLS